MKDKVTSLDVAQRAGVSRSAVSRVFTPGASASKDTAAKVMAAAHELGYRPNTLARAVVTGQSQIVGLVVRDIDNQLYPRAVEGLCLALQAKGYHVLVFMANGADEDIAPTIEELLAYQVDGIVMASVGISDAISSRCEAAGIPVILFNRGQGDPRVSEVTSDNYAGGRTVAGYLADGGHRRILHISGAQTASTGRDRAQGFVDGLKERGLSPVAVKDAGYDPEAAATIARRAFTACDRPDAVFVGSDHMAFAVMDVLRFELGLAIPDDVSVIGYDDVSVAAWPAYALTTIRQPLQEMTRVAVDMLLARIAQPAVPARVVLPGHLVIRESARQSKGAVR